MGKAGELEGGAGTGWGERRAETGAPVALSVPNDHVGAGGSGWEGRCRHTLRSLVNSLSGQ